LKLEWVAIYCSQNIHYTWSITNRGARIAQWYSAGLWDVWLGIWVPTWAGNFSLHHCIQTGSWTQPTSYPMGTRDSFPGGKATGAWRWLLTYI
jgi:hypothetical protein